MVVYLIKQAAVKWLKYCRYGLKPYQSIQQNRNMAAEQTTVYTCWVIFSGEKGSFCDFKSDNLQCIWSKKV